MTVAPRILAIGGEGEQVVAAVEAHRLDGAPTWDRLTGLGRRRSQAAAAALDGRVFVSGGRDADFETESSAERWDPELDAWTRVAPMVRPRYGHALIAWRGHLYAAGGSHQLPAMASVEVYDPGVDRWAESEPLPVALGAVRGAVVDDALWLVGASSYRQAEVVFEVWSLDGKPGGWRQLDRFTIERRWPASVIHAGSVYLVGGNADRRASARVDRFEVGAGAPAPALPELPGARQSAAAASVGGRVVVVGGRGDGFAASGQVDLFDPATATWSPGPPLAVARAGACIAVLP